MKNCDINCNCTVFHQDVLDEVKNQSYSDPEFLDLVSLFKLLSDLTRIKILESIKDHELCVCDLAYLLGVSKSAISHQMKLLKSYHLVESNKKGKMVYYHLSNNHMKHIIHHAYNQMKGQIS